MSFRQKKNFAGDLQQASSSMTSNAATGASSAPPSAGPISPPPDVPPPSYQEVMDQERERRRKNSCYSTSGDRQQSGPSWLYHFPQQSQFNTPFSSLQYEEFDSSNASFCGFDLLGEDPVQLTCPYCHKTVVTVVEETAGIFAYAASIMLCLLCCWPCALLPCCISDLMDVSHYCPKCSRLIHTIKKAGI